MWAALSQRKVRAMITRNRVTHMKSSIALTLIALALVTNVRAQLASNAEWVYQVDKEGNAEIDCKMQFDAKQWMLWKDQFGDHPDLMLRDLKYQMAAAVIDDFSLQKDDMRRTADAKIKGRCFATYRGNGQFQIQAAKDMKLVAGSGTEWVFTNSTLGNGGIMNITNRIKLPANAQNAHLVNGNDYNWLTYNLEVSPAKPKSLLYSGVTLLIIAGLLGAFSAVTRKASAPAPS
jgi:hypothetical protein